jgi:pSer/pThr/pTyr-binding forkhead associated (FHA) protein
MLLYCMNGFEEGLFLDLSAETTVLGAAPDLEQEGGIRLRHDETVADRHAGIEEGTDGLWIEPISSAHPVFVNERALKQRARAVPGDVVRLGQTLLLVCARRDELPDLRTGGSLSISNPLLRSHERSRRGGPGVD